MNPRAKLCWCYGITLISVPAGLQLAEDVINVFKQAAGVAAPQILARLATFGVQGRKEALDRDLFSTSPRVTAASVPDVAKAKPPPPLASTTAYLSLIHI